MIPDIYAPAFLLAASLANRLVNQLTDTTFSGLYHLQPFDWALLVPYFGVLVVLSVYGMHRYKLIHEYTKFRKNLPKDASARFSEGELPQVTIQLPLFNERYVVERLIEQTTKVRYPKHLLQIQVLDDSTD